MKGDTILLRQAHPKFVDEGQLTSQAFVPFPDGSHPVRAAEHYRNVLQTSCIELCNGIRSGAMESVDNT